MASFNVEVCKGMTQDEFVKRHSFMGDIEGIPKPEFVIYLKEYYQQNIKPLRETKKK